jgi:hypothetical protein
MNMKFTTLLSLSLCLAGVALVAGCSTPCQTSAMVGQDLPRASTAHEPVIVAVDSTVPARNLLIAKNFSDALVESVRKTGLFKPVEASGIAVYRLVATIEDLAQPAQGFNMTVQLEVDWKLMRVSDSQVLWHEKIRSEYTAKLGAAFAGWTRMRIATEGAARKNIEEGLAKLAAASF